MSALDVRIDNLKSGRITLDNFSECTQLFFRWSHPPDERSQLDTEHISKVIPILTSISLVRTPSAEDL